MYILAIETTGPHCSAALIDENGKVVMNHSDDRLNHLKLLTPMIDSLLKSNGLKMKDIDAVAASQGPGSFTGIRIGVSTARALGQVMDIPCIAVETLYAFSQRPEKGEDVLVCPILDARRNQVYANAAFGEDEVVKAGPYMLDEFLQLVEDQAEKSGMKKMYFIGDGVKAYGEKVSQWAEEKGFELEMEEVYQYADAVAKVALKKYNNGEVLPFHRLEPEYMRKAEAQRKLEERLKAEENGK